MSGRYGLHGFGGLVGCMAMCFGERVSEIVLAAAQSRLGSRVDA